MPRVFLKLGSPFFGAALILLLAATLPASATGAGYPRVWQTDDGLVNNNIHAIVQTPDNYLWVVTPVSLMLFDGVTFSPFPVKDFTSSIEPHNIRTVVCGRSGVLWVLPNLGSMVGLNPDFSLVTLPKTGLPTNAPPTLVEDGGGSLWLGYASGIYRVKDGQVTAYTSGDGVPEGSPQLTCDGAGNLWLAKGRQILLFQNGHFRSVAVTTGAECLAPSHTNAVWFTSAGHLFACHADGSLHDAGVFQSGTAVSVDAVLEDHAGAVWVATDGNGLFRCSRAGFERVATSHASVLSLAEDSEGNVWAGTGGGGLNRISLTGVQQEVFANDQMQEQVQSICEDRQGTMWGATHNGELVWRQQGVWQTAFSQEPFAGSVMCVEAGQAEGIWAGTRNGTLLYLNHTNITAWATTNGPIFALKAASSGDLWIVGRHLQRLHAGQLQNLELPRPMPRISAIAEDTLGNIWVGTKGVVLRYDGISFVDETDHLPIAHHTICCLYGARDGSMWIGCGGLGLLRYKNGVVGQAGLDQGLYNDYISQMAEDPGGWFWFGSDRGIFKIRRTELEQSMAGNGVRLRPIVYGRNEGLSSLEALFSNASPYVHPRATLTHDGRVWLLMHTGIVVADPKVLPEDFPAPPVLLTRVAMDGQTIASYGGVGPTQTVASLKGLNVSLHIPPGHRHLEFDFTAIHLSAPENLRFRYQLAGFDNDWIESGSRRSADYSRLPAGDYQFRAEACIGDGLWTETPSGLSLAVPQFLWQTWWFRLVAVALFTTCVIALARYLSLRRFQLQMRLLQQRAALDKERTRIARDLHDDLGGSLNSVALTLDMMQRGATPPEVNGKIRRCSMMVRQVAKSVDEIVWAINPRNDTLRYVVDYISQFAVEFMHAAEVTCRVDLPEKIPDRLLTPEVRHNLFLAVKETLNNIVRHARAGEVRLCITADENALAIMIEDNGQGFDYAPDNASSDGLRNMRQRIEEIGGQFQLDSRKGAGVRVSFRYAWPSGNDSPGNPNMPYLLNGQSSK